MGEGARAREVSAGERERRRLWASAEVECEWEMTSGGSTRAPSGSASAREAGVKEGCSREASNQGGCGR